jgi:hypothetical protein
LDQGPAAASDGGRDGGAGPNAADAPAPREATVAGAGNLANCAGTGANGCDLNTRADQIKPPLQASLRAERSNLGPLSARLIEIASSRTALLAMTASEFGRNLL